MFLAPFARDAEISHLCADLAPPQLRNVLGAEGLDQFLHAASNHANALNHAQMVTEGYIREQRLTH